jgi:hypothetical protein
MQLFRGYDIAAQPIQLKPSHDTRRQFVALDVFVRATRAVSQFEISSA